MQLKMFTLVGMGGLLALTACGGNDQRSADANMASANPITDNQMVPVAVAQPTLSAAQQQRRNALDSTAYEKQYRQLVDRMNSSNGVRTSGMTTDGNAEMAGGATGSGVSNTSAASNANGSGGTEGQTSNADTTTGHGAQARSMSFEQLDEDHNGKLSVAEFAVFATGLDPTAPKPNDQKMPYATADQLNTAADSFFYYDQNGDTYLQPDEFARAKAAMTNTK